MIWPSKPSHVAAFAALLAIAALMILPTADWVLSVLCHCNPK
jgi:hypothetical protein